MSKFPCPTVLLCDCAPTPFRNFSSERPDLADFFALAFFAGDPPLNSPDSFWTIPASVAPCESVVSQRDAQDCATRTVRSKVWDAWVPDGTHGVPVRQFFNAAQTCQISCATGEDPFVYTLPAGTVVALSQVEADELAASLCLFRAQQAKVCVPKPKLVTIDVVLMDDVTDLAKNARVISGGNGGFSAAYKNGSVHANDVPGSLNGEFFAASPDGHWVVGYDQLVFAGPDHATSWDMASGSVNDLGAGAFGRDGSDVTDNGAVLCAGASGQVLVDVVTGAVIADIAAAFPFGFGFETNARIMNNSRQVIGRSGAGDGRKMYRWTAGVVVNISPPLIGVNQLNNKAIAINEFGHACGTFRDSAVFQDHSWFYNGTTSIRLPDFGGIVNVKALNDSDTVVGEALAVGVMSAFMWTSGGGTVLLPFITGMTPGATGIATDVNNSGWIVGSMDNKGFVYKNGATAKLVDLLPPGTGWTSIDDALFINNLKQVVGHGTYLGIPGTLFIMQLV